MDFIHKVADYFVPHPHEQEHHIFDPDELMGHEGGGRNDTASAPAAIGQNEASGEGNQGVRPTRNRKKVEPYVASFVLKAKPLREVQGRRRNEKENDANAGGEEDNALVSSQGSEMSLASSQGSVIDPSAILGVPMSLASFNLSVTLKPEDDPDAKGTTFVVGASGPQARKRGKAVDRGHDVPSQGLLPVTERSEMGTDVPGPSLELMGRDYYDDYGFDAGAEGGMDSDSQRSTRSGRKRSSSPHVRIEDVTDHKEEVAGKGASPQKGGRGRKKSATPQPAKQQEREKTPEKGRNRKSPSTPPSSPKVLTETPKSAGPQKYGRGRKSKLDDTAEMPPQQGADETPKRRGRKASETPTPAATPQSSLETIFDDSMLTLEAEPGTPGGGRKKTPTPQSSQQEAADETPMATRGRKTPQALQEKPILREATPKLATRGRKKSASPKPAEDQPAAKQRKIGGLRDEDQESTKTDGSDRYSDAREELPAPAVPLDEMAKRELEKQTASNKFRGKQQPPSAGKQAPRNKMTEDLISSSGGRGGKRSTFRKKPQRKSEKAGTVFPVGRIHRMFREHESNRMRVGVGAAVYAAAAVEYLVAEVLEISGMVAKGEKKRRINPHHINRCIKGDAELDQLFGSAIIPEGGHEPYIHPALLPKKAIGKKEHAVGA